MKKEENQKKGLVIGLGIIIGILFVLAIIFLVLFIRKPKYEIKVNPGGGIIKRDIVIEDNVIKKLPEIEPPKDKVLVTWVNKDKEAIRPNLELTGNDTITPVFENKDRETVTLKFESGTNEKIPDIIITKGTTVILPVKPKHDKWKFLYWVDKDSYIVLNNRVINEDTTFYAYWYKPSDNVKLETVTIKYETGTDEKIRDIKLIKGSNLIFPTLKKQKEGMVFGGWLDDKDNELSSDSKAEKDMILKANWKKHYTCPAECVPSDDGSTCTKETIVAPTSSTECPSGSFEYQGDCITSTGGESAAVRQCENWDGGSEVMYAGGPNGELWCMKKVSKQTVYTCPAGYERFGENCKILETINCTPN